MNFKIIVGRYNNNNKKNRTHSNYNNDYNDKIEIYSRFDYNNNYGNKKIQDLKEYVSEMLNFQVCPCNLKICNITYNNDLELLNYEDTLLLSRIKTREIYVNISFDYKCTCSDVSKKMLKSSKKEIMNEFYEVIKNENKDIKLLEYISDDSNNSIDFQSTTKYISLMPNGLSVGEVKNKNNKLHKKNTKMSSNMDEYSENENENEKSMNLNIQLSDNIKTSYNNEFNNSDNNLILSHCQNNFLQTSSSNPNFNLINKYDKINKSENKIINDYENISLNKKSFFSPNKKKKKLILEVKKKNRGTKKSIYALEQKEEKKEEEKIYRRDKNGIPICKKNKRKVKIGFDEPFVNIIPIESFKKYNVMIGMPKGEKYINSKDDCQCCIVF